MNPRQATVWILAAMLSGSLAACGGGGGGATVLAGTGGSYRVTGTVAYGHPVTGQTIDATDSTGRLCASAVTASDGSYAMDTSDCAPGSAALAVRAYATPGGAPLLAVAVPAHSSSVIDGVYNIDPLTTALAYDAAGLLASATPPADSAQVLALLPRIHATQYLQARADILTASLLQALGSYGVSTSGFDPGSSPFVADGQQLDGFFDAYPLSAPAAGTVSLRAASASGPVVQVALPTRSGSPSTVTSVTSYSIGGSVSGLSGGTLRLLLNGANALSIGANGNFRFPEPVGSTYSVTVGGQPTGQTCTVSHGSGAGITGNVSNVGVLCSASTYSIGGTVSGLAVGAQLTLDDNGTDATTISANGTFRFSAPIAYASGYAVTVAAQPTGQTCTVANASASGVTAAVTNVGVTCSTTTYSIGGTLSGLAGGAQVTLDDNGADPTTLNANGTFRFSTPVAYGAGYSVTVATQPTGQICQVNSGSGSVAGADVGSVSVSCTSTNPLYVYLPDYDNAQILGYRIDTATGSFAPLPGSPFPAGRQDRWITVDASGTYAFSSNLSDNTLSAYSIDHATGALTQLAGSPYAVGSAPESVTLNPAGTLAFVPNGNSASLSVFSIDRASGALTPVPGSPFATGPTPTKVAINPTGTLAFVADQGGSEISVYGIDATTGALTEVSGSPFPNGPNTPRGITTDPLGTHLYVTNGQCNVTGYDIDPATGALTPISGSPFSLPGGCNQNQGMNTTFSASGNFAYVSSGQNSPVYSFSVDQTSGALTVLPGAVPDMAAGGGSVFATLDPSGNLLFEADYINIAIAVRKPDPVTGVLNDVYSCFYCTGARPYDLAIVKP